MLGSLSRVMVLVLVWSGTFCSAQSIQLGSWEARAKLVSTPGAGLEQFRLRCETVWPPDASRDPRNYLLRVEGPGGRSVTHALNPSEMGAGRWTTASVPAEWVRNRVPESVRVNISLVEASSLKAVSNIISAEIDDFPRPIGSTEAPDPGPFGWGEPIQRRPGDYATHPRVSPSGLRFVLMPRSDAKRQLLVASTEASIAQLKQGLPGYNPTKGRSDEFNLEDNAQPAINLTPRQANNYLQDLTTSDPGHFPYRLPTLTEWKTAMLAGRTSPFWWGSAATFPKGVNVLGPEPGLQDDTTAKASGEGFQPNGWGLFHTVGNAEEWVTSENGGFLRVGGHFRSELDAALPTEAVTDQNTVGTDPYVGVRPVFELSAEQARDAVKTLLVAHKNLDNVNAEFDLNTLTVTLSGTAKRTADVRMADEVVGRCWVVASVKNLIETPRFSPGKLAFLGPQAGPSRRITPLGRWFDEIPLSVKWAEPLPVSGSSWWLNVYPATGGHYAHRLSEEPNTSQKVTLVLDLSKIRPADGPVEVGLSLGAEAPRKDDPRLVSNLYSLEYR